MSTNQTLETLLRLGGLLKDAIAKSTEPGKKFDWKKFLESDEYGEIEKDVTDLLSGLSAGDLTKAIADIKAKEQALLGGKRLAELETDKLIAYSQLQNTRLMLAARKVRVKADQSFFEWLVEDAFPVLLSTARAVLPLVL
jgi:hypothetical protein